MLSFLRAARLFRFFLLLVLTLTVLGGCRGCGGKKKHTKKAQPTQQETEPPDEAPTATASASASAAPPVAAEQPVKLAHFKRGSLERHFEKHGAEMGYGRKEDYLSAAQLLVRGGPGIETHRTAKRDTYFFKAETNEFAALGPGNVIKTYFRPRDAKAYWERMKQR